jgi:hypothetical protein
VYEFRNGIDWISLGAGSRISCGWKVTNAALPPLAIVRARGFLTGGQNNGSCWFFESTAAASLLRPAILVNDPAFGIRLGHFDFIVAGLPGQVVIIESSPDLATWAPVLTNVLNSSPLPFTDPAPPDQPARFYRARVP